jgi:hypothetical protein
MILPPGENLFRYGWSFATNTIKAYFWYNNRHNNDKFPEKVKNKA